jgi:hypothetical protein
MSDTRSSLYKEASLFALKLSQLIYLLLQWKTVGQAEQPSWALVYLLIFFTFSMQLLFGCQQYPRIKRSICVNGLDSLVFFEMSDFVFIFS